MHLNYVYPVLYGYTHFNYIHISSVLDQCRHILSLYPRTESYSLKTCFVFFTPGWTGIVTHIISQYQTLLLTVPNKSP